MQTCGQSVSVKINGGADQTGFNATATLTSAKTSSTG